MEKTNLEIGDSYSLKDRLLESVQYLGERGAFLFDNSTTDESLIIVEPVIKCKSVFNDLLVVLISVFVLYDMMIWITAAANHPTTQYLAWQQVLTTNIYLTLICSLIALISIVIVNTIPFFKNKCVFKISDKGKALAYKTYTNIFNKVIAEGLLIKLLKKCNFKEDKDKLIEKLSIIFKLPSVANNGKKKNENYFAKSFRFTEESVKLYDKLFIVFPLFILFFSAPAIVFETGMIIFAAYLVCLGLYLYFRKKRFYSEIRLYELSEENKVVSYETIMFPLESVAIKHLQKLVDKEVNPLN